jgi:hypothetical protein
VSRQRKHTCSVCFAEGHDVRTCDQAERIADTSVSKAAATWLHDESPGGSFTDAAAKFGVTRESVRQAWGVLYTGEETPWQRTMRARTETIRECAANGMSVTEIAQVVGASRAAVAYTCFANGIAITARARRAV